MPSIEPVDPVPNGPETSANFSLKKVLHLFIQYFLRKQFVPESSLDKVIDGKMLLTIFTDFKKMFWLQNTEKG